MTDVKTADALARVLRNTYCVRHSANFNGEYGYFVVFDASEMPDDYRSHVEQIEERFDVTSEPCESVFDYDESVMLR